MNIRVDQESIREPGQPSFGSDIFDFEPHPMLPGPDVVDRDWSALLVDDPRDLSPNRRR